MSADPHRAQTLPAPHPAITPETKVFWDATSEGRLILPRCRSCHRLIWYPKSFCSRCATTEVDWIDASGHATIHSFTIVRRGHGTYGEAVPYVLAYVELSEGPRLLTNIIDCEPEALEIDQPVELVFCDTGTGIALPRFRPSTSDGPRRPIAWTPDK